MNRHQLSQAILVLNAHFAPNSSQTSQPSNQLQKPLALIEHPINEDSLKTSFDIFYMSLLAPLSFIDKAFDIMPVNGPYLEILQSLPELAGTVLTESQSSTNRQSEANLLKESKENSGFIPRLGRYVIRKPDEILPTPLQDAIFQIFFSLCTVCAEQFSMRNSSYCYFLGESITIFQNFHLLI